MILAILLGSLLCLCAPKSSTDTQWIEDVGGTVIRDQAGRITGVDLHGSWVSDTDLRK